MLGPTGHADSFARDNLPPAAQWPGLIPDGVDAPNG